ncbi:MAG: hypothetical protein DRP08_06505 [Candidatus Aenigmatarchaeota archaeon]|nr:MAG: hypothetical protein DRP08_06505 [Candidatus Aenigmarchaeota archaeon]
MKTLDKKLKNKLFPKNLILCGYRGSYAQNTYIPNSDPNSIDDIDLMGVYLAPVEYYIGLGNEKIHRKAFECFIDEWDTVSYEIRKFVNLLLNSNPNVLSLLWIKNEHYIVKTKFGQMLIDLKHSFASKKVYNSFTGYAYNQLKKMTTGKCEGYMGIKRRLLVGKYGYDTKSASHLIRLLTMGIEFLETGRLNVFRTHDMEKLKDIKTGKWSIEEVKKEAKLLFEHAEDAKQESILPDKPNYAKVEETLKNILFSYLCC